MSELSDLPDGCTQLVLEFLSIQDVAACAASCKKMAVLAQEPLMWLPRLKADFGVDIKVSPSIVQMRGKSSVGAGAPAVNTRSNGKANQYTIPCS